MGRTPQGERRIINILGGRVEGPRLSAEVLPGGADWPIVHADGASYHFRTTPRFETGSERHAWLTESLFVATARREPARILHDVFLVA